MIDIQKMTVSVVIPAFNEEAVIVDCLRALKSQTEPPDEIIVVDNNSTDSTAGLAAAFDGVSVIHEPKQGIAYARNAGFDLAASDIIARIDADTIVPPDWIKRLKVELRQPEMVGVSGAAEFYDHPFGMLASSVFNAFNTVGNRLISGSYILWGSNMAFHRSAWLKVRHLVNNDSNYWEDIDLSMRLLPFGRILYTRRLAAQTSARSSLVTLPKLAEYFARWPRTYEQFGWRPALTSRLLYSGLSLLWLPALVATLIANHREMILARQRRVQRRLKSLLGS